MVWVRSRMRAIDVFISYKREERALADQVSRALTKAGYVAVTDLNIQKATDFGDAIDGMIRATKLVVVLWTEASAASEWVRTEAREGKRLGKYYGVRVDAVEPDEIPVEVRNMQWLDLSETGLTKGLQELTRDILRKLGEAELSEQAAEEAIERIQADLEFYQVVDKIGDIGGYKKYLEVYPDGAYAEDAASKIDQKNIDMDAAAFKDAQEIGAVGGHKKYLAKFPDGAYAADAKTFLRNLDDRAYTDAKETGAVGGYKKYLEQFPQGRFVGDAQTFIRNHTGWRGGLRSVLPYLAFVTVFVAVATLYFRVYPPVAVNVDALEAELATLKTEKGGLQSQLDQVQSSAAATLLAEQQRAAAELADLEAAGAETMTELTEQLEDAQALTSSQAQQITELQPQVSTTQEEADEAKTKESQTLADLNALKTARTETEAALTEQIEGLRATIAAQSQQIADLQSNLSGTQPGAAICATSEGATGITIPQAEAFGGCVPLEVTELDLKQTDFGDVEALSSLTKLQKLNLWDTDVSDVSALSGLANLQRLTLWDTGVSDVSALSGLTSLFALDLGGTAVNDVSTLSGLTNLHQIILPDGKSAGEKLNDTPETRAAVQQAVANWQPPG
ncbi:MAG: TIR domain-containing protein [Pseudomonadota bacterium]